MGEGEDEGTSRDEVGGEMSSSIEIHFSDRT
jgi:hypothetical protein